MRKSTFEQIFFFLWVSHPVMIHDLNRRDESLTIGDKWRISVCQFSETDFKNIMFVKRYILLPYGGGIRCTWLLFWSCARWGGGTKKFLLQWSIIGFCITKLIVCLNSVWRASRMTLQRPFPILPWSTGPSYLQHNRYLFRGCQQLTEKENVLFGFWSVFKGCADSLLWQN